VAPSDSIAERLQVERGAGSSSFAPPSIDFRAHGRIDRTDVSDCARRRRIGLVADRRQKRLDDGARIFASDSSFTQRGGEGQPAPATAASLDVSRVSRAFATPASSVG